MSPFITSYWLGLTLFPCRLKVKLPALGGFAHSPEKGSPWRC